jgi:hypothetical protein
LYAQKNGALDLRAGAAALRPTTHQDSGVVWKAWGTIAGGSTFQATDDEIVRPFPRSGGEASLWVTRNWLALGVRAVGTISDEGPNTGDVSVLIGYHAALARRMDAVLGIGVGRSNAIDFLTPLPDETVLAASAQLNVNYGLVGLAGAAYGGVGSGRRYGGVGVGFSLGWFR